MEVIDRSGSSRELSRSVTRALQHSILQLCNEHVGYNHKLQILGVLCMTVDDDAQELVVKVNNTLKRVSANGTAANSRSPATSQTNTSTTATWTLPSTNTENTNSNHGAQTLDDSGRGSARSSPVQGVVTSKRSARKAAKPTKLQQFEDSTNISDDDLSVNETELVTSTPAIVKEKSVLHGSAKRKAQTQHRVPPEIASRNDTDSPDIDVRSYAEALGVNINGTNEDSNMDESGKHDHSQSRYGHGGSVYMAGTVEPPPGNLVDVDSLDASADSPYAAQTSDMAPSPLQENNKYGKVYIEVGNEFIQVKEEGREGSAYNSPLNLTPENYRNIADISGGTSSELRNRLETANNVGDHQEDGLSIQYTNVGPFTVNSQGQDVSHAVIKRPDFDAIGGRDYDETLEYMVDALGASVGRKKRRRVGEEELTPEEVAEYIGTADTEAAETLFKCKFCAIETNDVQRYIQHTMGSHHTYVCHQCGKCFTTKSSLLRHRPIHTGMRRFACSICKKTFYRKDKCKAHIKRHLGPDQNPDAFATTASLHEALDDLKPQYKSEQYVIDSNDADPSPSLGLVDAS